MRVFFSQLRWHAPNRPKTGLQFHITFATVCGGVGGWDGMVWDGMVWGGRKVGGRNPANWDRARKSVQRSVTWIGYRYRITNIPWHSHSGVSFSRSPWSIVRTPDGYGNGNGNVIAIVIAIGISNRNSIPGGLQWFVVAGGQVYKFNLSAMPQCCWTGRESGWQHNFIGLATVNPKNNATKLAEHFGGIDFRILCRDISKINRLSFDKEIEFYYNSENSSLS